MASGTLPVLAYDITNWVICSDENSAVHLGPLEMRLRLKTTLFARSGRWRSQEGR